MAQSTSTLFDYDLSGNITARHIFPYWAGCPTSQLRTLIGIDQYCNTIPYGYSTGTWGDMLTSYNGTTISYDAIGNPTNWRNGITNVSWNGRELNSFVKGSYTYSFEYNAEGIRTEQTKWYTGSSMAEIYHYVLDGTKIVSEYTTTSSSSTPSNVKYYFYDAAGSIAGFEYNGTTYYFQKNLQGDIIRICNISGNTVVEYTYDAWGKVLSVTGSLASTVGQANPFRYRGYYYDSETGFYYLQTRYYDPEVGRFLNADGYIGANGDIIGYNMYAYCSNRPTVAIDIDGKLIGWLIVAVVAVCVVTVAVTDSITTRQRNYNHNINQSVSNVSGFIEEQYLCSAFRFGKSTIDNNGCGCIAAYNAMVILGEQMSFPDTIKWFDNYFGYLFWGYCGTNPFDIGLFFKAKGYRITVVDLHCFFTDRDVIAKNAKANIVLYRGKGLVYHYVAYSYDAKKKLFIFHNPHYECTSIVNFLNYIYSKTGNATLYGTWHIYDN